MKASLNSTHTEHLPNDCRGTASMLVIGVSLMVLSAAISGAALEVLLPAAKQVLVIVEVLTQSA